MTAIPILTYHSIDDSGSVVSISPEIFAAQMRAIAERGWNAVPLGDAVAQREAHGCWPERTLCITFDDGFANLRGIALDELQRHGFGATVFVVTGHVGGYNDWEEPPPGLGRQPMLTWDDLAELASSGIEIGAHTRSHRNLTALRDDAIVEEMRASKRDIE